MPRPLRGWDIGGSRMAFPTALITLIIDQERNDVLVDGWVGEQVPSMTSLAISGGMRLRSIVVCSLSLSLSIRLRLMLAQSVLNNSAYGAAPTPAAQLGVCLRS